ncbi:MAG: adenosine deaminase [Chloroflexota bacterium]
MADELQQSIRALPKIELHRHLEGSVRLSTLVDIARKYGITMAEYEVDALRPLVQVMPDEPRTWQNFLAKFQTLRQFYLSADVIKRIAYESVVDAADDNVRYMELRFTPKALCAITKSAISDVVRWVCEAVQEATREHDIMVRLIVSMNRHESVQIGEMATRAAIDYMHMGVVGLDLAGIEAGYRAAPFRDIFRLGRDAGLRITLHAGEWAGPESVWDAIGNVGTDRIGHGIRSIEDSGVISVLKEREITLEVCPSSNVDSGVVADLGAHQLSALDAAGVMVTINTDDPMVSGITLSDELERVVRDLSMTIDDVKRLTMNAARAVFLPDSERQALVERFNRMLYPQQ